MTKFMAGLRPICHSYEQGNKGVVVVPATDLPVEKSPMTDPV